MIKFILGITVFCFLTIIACQTIEVQNDIDKPTPTGDNPFANWKPLDSTDLPDNIDTASFLGLYTLVFNTKCNNPACHDGTFEPDFRTPISAYTTLVFHSPIKNSPTNSFPFRVMPYEISKSWLYHRVTTDDPVLGRMPLYDTLAQWQVDAIKKWIQQGAPDIMDKVPDRANAEPFTVGYVAYVSDTLGRKLDTMRISPFNPFKVPKNSVIQIWLGIYDQGDNADLPYNLKNPQLLLSYNPFDFSQAAVFPVESRVKPHTAANLFSPSIPFYHVVNINTSSFNSNDIIYMRISAQDSKHTNATQIPEDGSQPFLKGYFSFQIE